VALRLSHSAIDKYKTCGRMFKLHYQDRIRETKNSSPLIFGSALDEALGIMLLQKKDDLTEEEKELSKFTPLEMFEQMMNDCDWSNVHFFRSDFDDKLLTEEELKLEEHERGKLSLLKKGRMMLDAYEKEVMPKIFRVVSIQSEDELKNENGDILTSKTDFIAEWETEGNVVLFDNKTSAKKYPKRSVIESQQLSIYSEAENIKQCGYIVCVKQINHVEHKTCKECNFYSVSRHKSCFNTISGVRCSGEWLIEEKPEVTIQVLIDDIPEETKELVFNEIQRYASYIKEEKFDMNHDSCFQYGRKCPYYDYCREGSMKGLIKLEGSTWRRNENKKKK